MAKVKLYLVDHAVGEASVTSIVAANKKSDVKKHFDSNGFKATAINRMMKSIPKGEVEILAQKPTKQS